MPTKYSTIFSARGSDLEFNTRVIMAVAFAGVCFGLPFGIYHLFWGNQIVGLVLAPVVVLQLTTLYLLKRNGFSLSASWVTALLQTTASVFFAFSIGFEGSYWLFASGVANYYITSRKMALSLNALGCLLVAVYVLGDPALALRYAASFILINIFLFSFAYQLERKNQQLDHMLKIDPLTHAGNRTALEEALRKVKNQFDRHQVPVSLIMIDLDHFKSINDTQGHSEGDKVLHRIARLIKQRLRSTDSLYRFGGEEFIVITENTQLDQAACLAEDIRRQVESHDHKPHDSGEISLTVSLGLAQLRSAESSGDWLSRADKAMYKAKAMGRNWVCFDTGTAAEHQVGKSSGTVSVL